MNFIYLHVVVVILIYLKETVGLADKNKNAHLVGKERRCDPTFAYQQVMYDVSREILHYTSRWVYIMLTLVILFTNHNDTCNLISVGICFGVCKRFQAYMAWLLCRIKLICCILLLVDLLPVQLYAWCSQRRCSAIYHGLLRITSHVVYA